MTTGPVKSQGAGRAESAPLVGSAHEPTIYELSAPGRCAYSLPGDASSVPDGGDMPEGMLADSPPFLPEVSERDLVAHYTRLAHRSFAVDVGAYPLGSCTMKYNPKVADTTAGNPGWTNLHPSQGPAQTQGALALLGALEAALCEIAGLPRATLQPAAGAAGELTGLLLMRAYHEAQGDVRRRVLIPDSAHGTNPASVTLGGYEVAQVPSTERGLVDLDALRTLVDTDVAGIMLTNPNTLGLFEEDIVEIAQAVHDVGGLLYYDGANLNAIMGKVRPGDMGFDIVHMNLHKTFATPHGGGGPGAGPVVVSDRLVDFLPGPLPVQDEATGVWDWTMPARSIGRVHGAHGNFLILVRAFTYLLALGPDGLERASERAVLNANYLKALLSESYDLPYPQTCMHEFVASASSIKRETGVRAMDIAKALIDHGFHPPTMYFPLIVDEALMIEPTETESRETLDDLAAALADIATAARADAASVESAPHNTLVGRLDEARAARRFKPREVFGSEADAGDAGDRA